MQLVQPIDHGLRLASLRNAAPFSKPSSRNLKILAILYKGGEAAKQEPRLLGTVENEVCMHALTARGAV